MAIKINWNMRSEENVMDNNKRIDELRQALIDVSDICSKSNCSECPFSFHDKSIGCLNCFVGNSNFKLIPSSWKTNNLKNKRAMISQPMSGLSELEIKTTREKAKNFLESRGFVVEDTLFDEQIFKDQISAGESVSINFNHGIFYLAMSLKAMALCDTVYFCKGWSKARGCIIEHEVAEKYGLELIYE